MSDSPVLVNRDEAVAIVTINRPQRRNALVADTKEALRDALVAVAADSSVRAVVLTGAGGHFCAGQDLGEHAGILAATPAQAFDTVQQHYSPIVSALATMPKPVLAAVEGTCVGAGLGFALACDLRIASATATFATAFSAIGLTCDSGLAHTLPRAVGEAKARELMLLAEPVTGAHAVELGLVTRHVDPGRALDTAVELATRFAAGPTAAYAETKILLAESYSTTLSQTLAAESLAQARAGATADHAGAVEAFLSKRQPLFTGS